MERVFIKQNKVEKAKLNFPGLVVAGLCGGAGKTMFSIGLIAALRYLGVSVAPFKKGPDYIDAGWLALAAGRSCHNLDTFLIKSEDVLLSYQKYSCCVGVSIVEGNRGLYDCINIEGKTSTAELAKLLNLPVILCVDATKTTRTMAAIISGILNFDPNVSINGIILNRIAGVRHQNILTKSIEEYCGVPILGAIPKLNKEFFPERHMGLVPTPEHEWARSSIYYICDITRKYIDVTKLLSISGYSSKSNLEKNKGHENNINNSLDGKLANYYSFDTNKNIKYQNMTDQPIIGIMRDSAFQFYYPENFEALISAGASIVFISPLESNYIPNIDALYIGGGFPETHAKILEKNVYIKNKVKFFAEAGMPIYAECGGLIYLGEKLLVGNMSFKMTGVLPAVFKIWKKPKGHGYTILKVKNKNPYYPVGSKLLGHEFHYSSVEEWRGRVNQFAFSVKRGSGLVNGKDGVFYKNVMATYTHIHALGVKNWAISMVKKANEYMKSKIKRE